jgi:hypothetical protein
MEAHVAHFSVTGDYLCDIVRDLVVSERWDGAQRVLDDVHGLTRPQQLEILTGKAQINTGLTDLEPLPADVAEAYQRDVAYIYAGRVRLSGYQGWWRPIAALTDFGPNDLDPEIDAMARELQREYGLDRIANFQDPPDVFDAAFRRASGGIWARRASHYCLPGEVAVVTRIATIEGSPLSSTVIFEACNAPPPWLPVYFDATKAVEHWLAVGHHVEARGHVQRYGFSTPRVAKARVGLRRAYNELEAAYNEGRYIHAAAKLQRGAEAAVTPEEKQRARDAEAAYVQALRDERERLDEEREKMQLQKLRDDVAAQFNENRNGYLVLPMGELRRLLIPRAPFTHYAVDFANKYRKRPLLKPLPTWKPVAGPNFKLVNDNPYHSDWILGALDESGPADKLDRTNVYLFKHPNDWYTLGERDEETQRVIYDAMRKVEDEYLGSWTPPKRGTHRITVLYRPDFQGSTTIEGSVIHPEPDQEVDAGTLAVVPTLGPDFYITAASAGGGGVIISPVGGELAHLVTVAHDHATPFPALLVLPDAVTLLPEGTRVRIDITAGTLEIL